MRLLPAVLLVAAIVRIDANIRLPDPSWAVEVKPDPTSRRLLELSSISLADEDITCKKIFSCADCNTSRVCRPKDDGTLKVFANVPCPEERPYCDEQSGTCVNSASMNCGADDTFVCLEKNHFFPDTDCKRFHYCNNEYVSKLFQCIGEGTVYDAVQQKCIDGSACGTFDCEKNSLKKMKHSNFPRYYAMCKNDNNDNGPLVVGVCPPYYQISNSNQKCEPDCKAHGNGNIPDAKDCTKYYICSETKLADGSIYMQTTYRSCPTANSFDTTLFMCVPDPNGKICKK